MAEIEREREKPRPTLEGPRGIATQEGEGADDPPDFVECANQPRHTGRPSSGLDGQGR